MSHFKSRPRTYTAAEVAEMLRLRDEEELTIAQIAERLGLRPKQVACKFNNLRARAREGAEPARRTIVGRMSPITAEAPAAEAVNDARRRATLTHRSLTAALLGDPLPGYSALDLQHRGA